MDNLQKAHSRENWIDILKGLLLLIVCLFHTNNSWYGSLGFLFNMPAFFFLSGLLFDEKKNSDFVGYILKKTKTLLIPYLGLSVFFLFFTPLLYVPVGYENGVKGFLYSSMLEIVLGFSAPYTLPLWFVYVLFIVCIVFWPVNKICQNSHILKIIILFLSLASAWWFNKNHLGEAFHIRACTIAFFFYALGYNLKGLIGSMRELKAAKLGIVSFVLFILYFIGYSLNGHADLRTCSLGDNIVGFLLGTIGGIGFILSAVCIYCKMFSTSLFSNAMIMISKNSLTILAVHYWVLMCLLWFYDFSRPDYYLPMAIMSELLLICTFCYIFNHWLKPLIGK